MALYSIIQYISVTLLYWVSTHARTPTHTNTTADLQLNLVPDEEKLLFWGLFVFL